MLFVCTGNSARSPIAEALLRHRTNGRAEVVSAGIRPRTRIHPGAVRVLNEEFGIDLTSQRPRSLDTMNDRRFDYLISLCDKAREALADFSGQARRLHWSVLDPAAGDDMNPISYTAFKHAANDIDTRVRHLLPVLTDTRP